LVLTFATLVLVSAAIMEANAVNPPLLYLVFVLLVSLVLFVKKEYLVEESFVMADRLVNPILASVQQDSQKLITLAFMLVTLIPA